MKHKWHMALAGVFFAPVLLSLGLVSAQVSAQVLELRPEVLVASTRGAPMGLYPRLPSGAPKPGASLIAAELIIRDDRFLWRVVLPSTGFGASGQEVRSCALILWDIDSPDSPPSILYLHSDQSESLSVVGRLFVPARLGGPLGVSQSGLLESLGVSGRIHAHSGAPEIEFSIPLPLMQALFPAGVMADARILLREGALYSSGAAGSWFEPPDVKRTDRLRLQAAVERTNGYLDRLKAIAAQSRGSALSAGIQRRAGSANPLPLDPAPDVFRAQFLRARALRANGDEVGANAALRQIQALAPAASLTWQESLLELQLVLFEAHESAESIDVGLKLIESDCLESGVAIRSLRALAMAFAQAGVRLGAADPLSSALRDRLLRAVSDNSFRATFGADLLLLHNQLPDAVLLLESVRSNPFAPAATRAMAMYRLAQLNLQTGEWRGVLRLVEQIQDEMPSDTRLRGNSLALLDHVSAQDVADTAGFQSQRQELSRRLAADTEKARTRNIAVTGGTQDRTPKAGPRKEQ